MRPLAVGASAKAGIAQAIQAAYARAIVTRVIVDILDGRRQGMYAIREALPERVQACAYGLLVVRA